MMYIMSFPSKLSAFKRYQKSSWTRLNKTNFAGVSSWYCCGKGWLLPHPLPERLLVGFGQLLRRRREGTKRDLRFMAVARRLQCSKIQHFQRSLIFCSWNYKIPNIIIRIFRRKKRLVPNSTRLFSWILRCRNFLISSVEDDTVTKNVVSRWVLLLLSKGLRRN